MTGCDVLIVGGGPAGAACAGKLHEHGFDVLVLDKKTFPRDKPCAGWITPAVVDELQINLEDYSRGRVLEPITGFCTGLIGGAEVMTRYGKPISYGIRRCEFDEYLLRRSGARLQLGEPLKKLKRSETGWQVNDHIETPLIIGAGGHFCPVARHLGAQPGNKELAVAAQEIEFEMTQEQLRLCPVEPGIPYLYFCDDLRGYGWYYRKGNYLNVGLGREDDENISGHVRAFCDFLTERKKIPGDIKARFAGHAYLLYARAPRRLIDDGVLLVGDAAGMAYPQSGEGIRPAVESALIAANLIHTLAGDYRRENLARYEEQLTARFGKKSSFALSDLLPFGLKRLVAGVLMASHWFSRKVIVERWFLHTQELPLSAVTGGIR
jgi:geranylgeranyl reductase family protein